VFSCDLTHTARAAKVYTCANRAWCDRRDHTFNHPLNQVVHKSHALATNNRVVLKPSEKKRRWRVLVLADILYEAGLRRRCCPSSPRSARNRDEFAGPVPTWTS